MTCLSPTQNGDTTGTRVVLPDQQRNAWISTHDSAAVIATVTTTEPKSLITATR